MKKWFIVASALSLTLLFSSCSVQIGGKGSGPLKGATIIDTKKEKNIIEVEDTKSVKLDLNIGVAKLNIEGGSDKLMDGEFIYNVEEWKPVVNFTKGENSRLEINQPNGHVNNIGNNIKYEWNLKFNDKIPFNIVANMGVGKSDMNFSKINLESLELNCGVGTTELDISGNYKHDVDVKIEGGVGATTIFVPKDMNVNIAVDKGIGALDISGFNKNESNYSYENKASQNTMNIKVSTGVGAVKVVLK